MRRGEREREKKTLCIGPNQRKTSFACATVSLFLIKKKMVIYFMLHTYYFRATWSRGAKHIASFGIYLYFRIISAENGIFV